MTDMLVHAILWHVCHAKRASGRMTRIAGKARLVLTIDNITVTVERTSSNPETMIVSCAQPTERKEAWERFLSYFTA